MGFKARWVCCSLLDENSLLSGVCLLTGCLRLHYSLGVSYSKEELRNVSSMHIMGVWNVA